MLSALLARLTLRHTLRNGMIDMPNQRSSHTIPTPRGGGLAIAITFLAAILSLGMAGLLSAEIASALLGGGALVAFAGWRDDRHTLSISLRFAVHFAAALWALFWLEGMNSLQLGFTTISWQWAGVAITALGIVWLINLYNFMDGIDGLAGAQAICAAVGGAILLWISGAYGLALSSLALAAAAAGFLIWNWPPARIFMGDVGSGLLGFSFAVLALASEKAGALPVLAWLILLAVFIMDASFTLLRRILNNEAWLQAHRTHAYQRAVQAGASHLRITMYVAGLNIMVLWPLAWLAWLRPQWLLWIFLAVAGLAWLLWASIQRKFTEADEIQK
ncbi:MAG: glycosyltransferase family 4 protein [Gammaproteobacteria bacterium]